MFIKKLNNKNDVLSGANEFIKLECSITPPFNFPKQYILSISTPEAFKTAEQNKLFHSLLQAFWESGCSSFESYDDLRLHYKEIASLIQYKQKILLSEKTKRKLWEFIKDALISLEEKSNIVDILKSNVRIENSWSTVSKDKATFTINELVNNCIESGAYASSSKVKTIIDELNNLNNITI